jgi:hypothetical protein
VSQLRQRVWFALFCTLALLFGSATIFLVLGGSWLAYVGLAMLPNMYSALLGVFLLVVGCFLLWAGVVAGSIAANFVWRARLAWKDLKQARPDRI